MSDERKPLEALWTPSLFVTALEAYKVCGNEKYDSVAMTVLTMIRQYEAERQQLHAALAERDERIAQLEAQVETLELTVDGYKLDIKNLRTDLAAYTAAYNARSPHGLTRTRKKGSHE